LLYIRDALELFGAALPALDALWEDEVQPVLSKGTASRVVKLASETFTFITE